MTDKSNNVAKSLLRAERIAKHLDKIVLTPYALGYIAAEIEQAVLEWHEGRMACVPLFEHKKAIEEAVTFERKLGNGKTRNAKELSFNEGFAEAREMAAKVIETFLHTSNVDDYLARQEKLRNGVTLTSMITDTVRALQPPAKEEK